MKHQNIYLKGVCDRKKNPSINFENHLKFKFPGPRFGALL